MRKISTEIRGPVYPSWEAAFTDPDLDISKPWYVAPDPESPLGPGALLAVWPPGWKEIGSTRDQS